MTDAAEEARAAGLEAGRECLEAALRYAGLGLSVTCCPPDHVGVGKWHLCELARQGATPQMAELSVVFADMRATLPSASEVDLAECTEAGRLFRREMTALWSKPQTWEVCKDAGRDVASRASLVSRMRGCARPYLAGECAIGMRECWRPIHEAFAAWWRLYQTSDGEVRVALSMRYCLAAQVGVEITDAHDQASLTRLGERYGCVAADPDLSSRLSDGSRLAVLTPSFVDDLLARPAAPEGAEESFTDTEGAQ